MRCFAPAKLNLALDLGPPRGDGYHAIRTVMQAVSLGDRLFVTPAPAFALTDPDVDGPDLVERAARLFTDATGVAARVRVEVRKRIPLGAGLGGGSSDAAATLRALRELLLPALLLPFTSPLLLGAVSATRALYSGSAAGMWLWLMAAFDGIFILVPVLLFEYLTEV